MSTSFSTETQTKKPFYKRPAGVLLIGIASIIGLFIVGFIGISGYYFFKIQTGTDGDLAKEFSSGFTKTPGLSDQTSTASLPDILQRIRKADPKIGSGNEPITILAFIDFECPFCQQSYPIFQKISKQYNSAVHIVFKHFPIDSIHPNATQASLAAACAQEQGRFWNYYGLLFEKKNLSESSLFQYANQLGLDTTTFSTCLSSKKYLRNVQQDLQDGIDLGVRGTPTYFVNDVKVEGVITEDQWNTLLLGQLSTNNT